MNTNNPQVQSCILKAINKVTEVKKLKRYKLFKQLWTKPIYQRFNLYAILEFDPYVSIPLRNRQRTCNI